MCTVCIQYTATYSWWTPRPRCLYASINTRPDIAYATSYLCRAMSRPSPDNPPTSTTQRCAFSSISIAIAKSGSATLLTGSRSAG